MSLKALRKHCSQMSEAEHHLDCPSITAVEPYWDQWAVAADGESMVWRGPKPKWERPTCDGCNSEGDRELYAQIVAEIDSGIEQRGYLFSGGKA